jgi:hypothetical protein
MRERYFTILVVLVLFAGGTLIGFGARREQGLKDICTQKGGVWLHRDFMCISKDTVIDVRAPRGR